MENNLLFVYGILKRGFELDLRHYGATFVGESEITGASLYGIHDGVGLRLNDDPEEVAHGEIFTIPDELWGWLDTIETNGHVYERKEVLARSTRRNDLIKVWVYEHIYMPVGWYSEDRKLKDGVYKPSR